MAEKIAKYGFPSHYGSHKSMTVVPTEEEKVILKDNEVVCEDEFGRYITQADRLDNGMHDSNRTDSSRMQGAYYQSILNKKENR